MLPGDVMAFENVLEQRRRLLEESNRLGMRDRDADERGDVLAETARIDRSVVAGDNTAVLELLDPLDHGWGGKPYLLAELDQRDSSLIHLACSSSSLLLPGRSRLVG